MLVGTTRSNVNTRLLDTLTLVPRAVGLVGLILLVALLATLVACSPGAERETQRSGEDAGKRTAQQGTVTSSKRAETVPGAEGETTTTYSSLRWDYVALGDSLAAGVGARRGYVDRYAEHLQSDTGARLRVINLGRSGLTSSQLLHSLRNDPEMRKALGRAEVVTLNIGLNDLGLARNAYESGTCGGPQNQACLREAVKKVEGNWAAIIEEISGLRSTDESIIRTAGLGYTPRARGILRPYVAEVTHDIASAAAEGGIPYVEVRLGDEDMSVDGLHPNDRGYRVIAARLRGLGHEPLAPP